MRRGGGKDCSGFRMKRRTKFMHKNSKYHNENGAIFLDENCNLNTRPYTLMIYGHNMKSGAMFGCLRNYENLSFYKENPFITFDTIYEDGRYVIFSIATLDVINSKRDIEVLSLLNTSSRSLRQQAINALASSSVFKNEIDVDGDDQLLLLITCVGNENERRILTARRIQEGESEAVLRMIVEETKEKW